jgi:hypothetical protein
VVVSIGVWASIQWFEDFLVPEPGAARMNTVGQAIGAGAAQADRVRMRPDIANSDG